MTPLRPASPQQDVLLRSPCPGRSCQPRPLCTAFRPSGCSAHRGHTRAAPLLAQLQLCTPQRPSPHGHGVSRRSNVVQLCVCSTSEQLCTLQQLAGSGDAGMGEAASPSGKAAAIGISRRALAAAAVTAAMLLQQERPSSAAEAELEAPAAAEAASSSSGASAAAEFVNRQQGYRVYVPVAFEKIDKAGADALWEDPGRRSTSVGVTVSPVRIKSLQQFGALEPVGQRLLQAEKAKESTLSVAMVRQSERSGAGGALLYDYEYELDSTRGRKRILNTVSIYNAKLFILNAVAKCEKEEAGACGAAPVEAALEALRRTAASFDVLEVPQQ